MSKEEKRAGKQPTDPKVRFWRRVSVGNGCWNWMGSKDDGGYGRLFMSKSKAIKAHRVSWNIHFGDIPSGMLVLHRCDNAACVNPGHLFLGTNKDNSEDMVAKGRNHWGEAHHGAKLTIDQVNEIRSARSTGKRYWGAKALAKRFGVSERQIMDIASGKWWRRA